MTRPPPRGTQSITRAIEMMKVIAERKEIGWRLTDLAARCGLGKATAYRIVASLTAARIVLQRTGDRRYVPGPLMFELAVATPAYFAFTTAVHDVLVRIARPGVNAFHYLRSGDEVVCVDFVGTTTVQPLTVRGRRRPLGQSTFGIAMILEAPKAVQRELLAASGPSGRDPGPHASAYRKVLAHSRRAGFGYNPGCVAPGLTSVAVALLDARHQPFAAIGVTVPSASLRPGRVGAMAELLRREARRIEEAHPALIAEISH